MLAISVTPFLEAIIELFIIWMCIFLAFKFLRATRGSGVFLGLVILLIPVLLLDWLVQETGLFSRLAYFSKGVTGVLVLSVIIIFQPELRQAAVRVTQSEFFARFRHLPSAHGSTITAIADAVTFLSRNQFGGIIAIERENSTIDHVIGGQTIDAQVSASLLKSIFWPNNPLHDLGLILRGDRIIKACVQFPLADESAMLSPDLGSRHRAAVGLSMRCDALIVIVSEQTGRISLADQGTLTTIDPDDMENELALRITPTPEPETDDQPTFEQTEDQHGTSQESVE